MIKQRYQQIKAAEGGALLSLVAYFCIAILKLLVSFYAHSEALRADGLNNFTDLISSITVLIGLQISRKPSDQEHHYGHWKSENIASLVTSLIMVMVGLQVCINALINIFQNETSMPDPWAGLAGLVSAGIMVFVYEFNRRLARKVHSTALLAAAKDNLSDVWTSLGTAVAVIAAALKIPWLDNGAALVIGGLILKTAWDIFRDSSFSLSDGFDEKKLVQYQQAVAQIPFVRGVKKIRGRSYGDNIFLEVVVLMDPDLTVRRSHAVTEQIEHLLQNKYHIFDVDVHVEPTVN
ncbi:Cation diffusion facilitator family transporter [Bombilactobacillus mellifer]|uniref:Cation diffusion facilitator family transporter n=1 Tax=Bombilactobacillus mellifer TaxID=1218492 RepID=A0A0F4LUP6_9LACO|nr:cation diffusion facilitator family transporter [Bombilactobacillus mellifer]KJY61994.1 Cation diffusion facilitator family transporter [Bombilactobacillus mellifer]